MERDELDDLFEVETEKSPEKPKEKSPAKKKAKEADETKKRGRPKGATRKSIHTSEIAPRCPACGSSARGTFTGSTVRHDIEGEIDGKPYNEMVVRRTRCECGQVRIVKTFEYYPKKKTGRKFRS